MSFRKKELKQSNKWNIAATHYLTAGFAMPILISIAVDLLFTVPGPFIIISSWLFSIFIGVVYSASYLNKTYIIEDVKTIAKISTIYNFVFYLVLVLNSAIKPFNDGVSGYFSTYFSIIEVWVWVVIAVLSSAIIYFTSLRFIKN